jgi:hypothetical protein
LSVEDRVITVTGAVNSETAEDGNIFGTTPVTAIDFLYNLIPNGSQEDYLSLQDPGALQRYFVRGLDATDVVTVFNFYIGSDSWGWVTHEPISAATGETDQVTIKGAGISADYRQQFTLTQYFINTPMWLTEQVNNFADNVPPDTFQDRESIKHICRVDAKFNEFDPNVPHTGSAVDKNGVVAWFGQNAQGSRPEYYIDSVVFEDDLTATIIDTPDFNRVTNVTVTLKSVNSLFTTATQIVIGAMYLPMDEEDFVGTEDWLRHNLFFDRVLMTLSDTATGGDMEGTDYQQLKNIDLTSFSASTATIEYQLDLSTALKDKLKRKAPDNRRDTHWIAIKDPTGIVTTADNQRLAILVDSQIMAYNQEDPTLWEIIDRPLVYEFPTELEHPATEIVGFEGDPLYTRLKFRTETAPDGDGVTPTFKTAKVQILATHATKSDFLLEEKIFDVQNIRKLEDKQTINLFEDKGYTTYEDDPRNRANLFRVPANDTGSKAAYEMQYGIALRYEYWIQALPFAEGATVDIFQDIENVSERWNNFSQVSGWELKTRWTFTMIGYDGAETDFVVDVPMRVLTGSDPAETPPLFTGKVQYFTEDTDAEIMAIVEDGTTLIRATFVGDFSTMPSFGGQLAVGFYGWMFADVEGSSGITGRRFASTEIPSEEDSPWSPTDADPAADESYADGNLRLNRYDNTIITIEGLFDSSQYGTAEKILIYPRLGFRFPECLILLENGTPVLQENGEGIKLETCL